MPVPVPSHHRSGPLQPGELAQASVLAALCAVTAIISVVVPFAAGLALLGTVPMGLLAYRYRLRVLIAATVAAGMIAFLIAGMGGFMAVVNSAYIGGLTGVVKRKGRSTPTVIVTALIAGFAFGAANVAALAVLARLRHLIFGVMTANTDGTAAFLTRIHMQGAAATLKHYFAVGLHYWPWVLLGSSVVQVLVVSLIGWWALSRVLERMRGIPDVHKLDAQPSRRRISRSDRFRCGWTRCASVTPAPAKTRCASSVWICGSANTSRSPVPTVPERRR